MKRHKVNTIVAVSVVTGIIISITLFKRGTEMNYPVNDAVNATCSKQSRVKRPSPRRLSIDNVDRVSAKIKHLQKSDSIITLEEIYALGENVSYEDRLALYEWVRISETDEETLYLKDEVFNQLERQEAFPEEYAEQLSDMALDQSLDSDLRGYLLQHLRLNYEEFTDFQKAFVLDTFYDTLKESENDAGGTALINLTEMIKKGYQIDSDSVKEAAYTQAFEQTESIGNQATAIQCCVELGIKDISEQLKEVIDNEQSPVGLKLSAVAALASTAGSIEKKYLRMLSSKGGGLYKKAIENNLK